MNHWLFWLQNYLRLLPWIIFIIADVGLIVLLMRFGFRFYNWRTLRNRKLTFIQITPPSQAVRTVLANDELVTGLYGLDEYRTRKDKLLGRHAVLPLEVTGSYEGGIRYVIPVVPPLAESVKHIVTSYLPDVKLTEIDDYIPADIRKAHITEFKLLGPWKFALKRHNNLEQHDPMDYVTNALSKLHPGQHMTLQIIGQPVKLREAASILHKILHNEDILSHSKSRTFPVGSWLLYGINTVLFAAVDGVSAVWHGPSRSNVSMAQRGAYDRQQVAQHIKPARTLSVFEQQIVETTKDKVSQQLFSVNIRAMIVMDNPKDIRGRVGTLRSSFESYSVPGYQGLHTKPHLSVTQRYKQFLFQQRMPAFFRSNSCVLSASEVASLYHFPLNKTSRTDNLVTSLSRTLPAPLSLKQGTLFDVVIGRNYHHGTETDIGLTAEERARHVYVIGGTGNGKTTMLQYGIIQDIMNGKGVAVIDPHGDMAVRILKHIPEERTKDVIYFNPDDLDHPIGLNLLEMKPGLTGNALNRERDKITESVVSIFRKIFSDEDVGGHRVEYVLRNTILTAMTVEGATIFTVLKLLQNSTYRKTVTDKLKDEGLKDFWKSELGQAGNMQRVKMSLGVTSKVTRFRSSASSKLILQQKKSTIDFEDIINSGKILICNFAKGALGEDTAQLFGVATLAKLQLAAYRRVYMDEEDRKPFYLYVDEFQNFATAAFEQMLSESRKYKVYITMAEQSLSQQDDRQMVGVILANVGTTICFKTGNPDDEKLLLAKFKPYFNEGEIQRLSAYNFFVDLSAMQSQEPTSGKTLLLPDTGSKEVAQRVIALSQATYGGIVEDFEDGHIEEPEPASNPKPAPKPTSQTKPPTNVKPKKSNKKKHPPKEQKETEDSGYIGDDDH